MYEELLARVPLFQRLSTRELAWLADACQERSYGSGDDLMRQDSSMGRGLVILLAGRVRVSRAGSERGAPEPEYAGAGALLGERALLVEEPGGATVTATEPTRALVLPIWDFRTTLRDYPDIAIHLLAVLGEQIGQRDVARQDPQHRQQGATH